MLQRAYNRILAKAGHENAPLWLALLAFAESSFFLVPPDLMLIPMVLAKPHNWFRLAGICTLSSVFGGFLGYAIGFWAMDSIGHTLLDWLGLIAKFDALKPLVDQYGVWLILIKGMTPIPYKLITISAGAFHFDLVTFAFASLLTRGMRFFLVAILLWRYGEPMRVFIEKRLVLVTSSIVVAVVGGVLLLKLI
jgi:membrane protein YqaA with SNARE-associated domain